MKPTWFFSRHSDGSPARRTHGYPGSIVVRDRTATFHRHRALHVAAAVGDAIRERREPRHVEVAIGPAENGELGLSPEAEVSEQLAAQWPPPEPSDPGGAAPHPVRSVLAFESLMNSDREHNDHELSQGVLHLISCLPDTEVMLARVKMPIVGGDRPTRGLEGLGPDVADADLVLVTLLEGYWHGAVALLARLRELGCRAHVAVGGVMPSLTPEHVAAHLHEATFFCRGDGEQFVPRLAALLGGSSIDQPLTPAQIDGLRQLPGLVAVDRAGATVVTCELDQIVKVPDLDAVKLDLSYLEARHVERGIEISTARGCVHACSFCTILGRKSYNARSPEGVLGMLEAYEARFVELFEGHVPANAHRVHIADDDFACDKARALAVLEGLRETDFRLSSFQVSVADLCLRDERGRLLPEVDPDWVAALDPTLFADHGRDVPRSARLHDHRPRGWSSYLQIGVETFCDTELGRLAKGYKVAHIRAAVAALDARGIHHDAYFIASNTDTTAEQLAESLEELVRLKLRHPVHFHLMYPTIPHLVSYFPSATYKRKVRAGRQDSLVLRDELTAPGYPEFDYPLVSHDVPDDPLVAHAVTEGFLTDGRRYGDSLEALRRVWMALESDDVDRAEQELAVRRLDDRLRHLVFELLRDARRGARGQSIEGWTRAPSEAHALETASELLGESSTWLPAFQRFEQEAVPRLVVIPTWQCELRCRYCYIPKQDHRVMQQDTMNRAIDLLLSSSREALILQFFGGEALLERDMVMHAIEHGTARARALGKRIQFILSSNGWSLDEELLAWLSERPVKLELSLDGDTATQNTFRPSRHRGEDSYQTGIAPRAAAILASGLPYDVIMVVHPRNVEKLAANFLHIASLGFQRIQINFALGPKWSQAHQQTFVAQLHELGRTLLARWAEGDELVFINAASAPMPVRLNGEVTVDWDGTIYGGNAFLHETEHKSKFVVGHLDDLHGFDRYWLDQPSNEYLLEYSYAPDVTENNLGVGRLMASFCRWLRRERGLA